MTMLLSKLYSSNIDNNSPYLSAVKDKIVKLSWNWKEIPPKKSILFVRKPWYPRLRVPLLKIMSLSASREPTLSTDGKHKSSPDRMIDVYLIETQLYKDDAE